MKNPYESYNLPHECEEFIPQGIENYKCSFCNEEIKKREFLYFLEKNCKLTFKNPIVLTSNRYNEDLITSLYDWLIEFGIFNISYEEFKKIRRKAFIESELREEILQESLYEEFTEILQVIQPEGFYFDCNHSSEDSYGYWECEEGEGG